MARASFAVIGTLLVLLLLPVRAPAQDNTDWTWVDRSGVVHTRADLAIILASHEQWVKSDGKDGKGADLAGANLSKADLSHAILSGVDLHGANLSDADLEGAVFTTGGWDSPAPVMHLRVRVLPLANGPTASYLDLIRYFFRGFVTPQTPAHVCASSFTLAPDSANLSNADLRRAKITNARLLGTNLEEANLAGANLNGSTLQGVDMKGANLFGTTLSHTVLEGSDMEETEMFGDDLSNADAEQVNFKFADLAATNLQGVDLHGALLCNSIFEPASLPTDTGTLAEIRGLAFLTYQDSPNGLTEMRSRFRQEGYEDQDRQVTYALKWHDEGDYWARCTLGSSLACFGFFRNELLFNWTCAFGLYPERPLLLLVRLWFLCAIYYWLSLRFASRGGIYVIPARQGARTVPPHPKLQRLGPRSTNTGFEHAIINLYRVVSGASTSRAERARPFLKTAFWFSTLSASNIGFRDISAGRWIRLLTKREYDIQARGWPRVVAGFQSLSSVYLLALWLLTYFGRPFG